VPVKGSEGTPITSYARAIVMLYRKVLGYPSLPFTNWYERVPFYPPVGNCHHGMASATILAMFYQSPEWKSLRLKALQRDGYCCTKCGTSVRGFRQSRVDHIKPRKERPDLALMLGNLRTLCVRCDAIRHNDKGGHNALVPRAPTGADGFPIEASSAWNIRGRNERGRG
jgi:5-methylcytosine-specific restriction protein A